MCIEKPAPEHKNECCVVVVCATLGEKDEQEQEKDVDENIQFLQITPTTIQVQFPDITGGNLKYVEDRNSASKNWENAIILEGNKIFTLTGLTPGASYRYFFLYLCLDGKHFLVHLCSYFWSLNDPIFAHFWSIFGPIFRSKLAICRNIQVC